MMKLTAVLASAVLAFGCAGAKVKSNPSATFPIPASEAEPAFLFPINLSHLGSGGDPMAMGVTVTAGVASKFGKNVVSGQQLFDLVGNMSYELAEQIRSQAESGQWEMTGSAGATADALSKTMETVVSGLVSAKLIEKPINFRYIIALHSHGSPGMGGAMLNAESWGGIYDMQTRQISSYILSSDNFANKPEAVMGQLPSTYNGIIEKLLAGK